MGNNVVPFPRKPARPDQMERWSAAGAVYDPPNADFPYVGVVIVPHCEPSFVHAWTYAEADQKMMTELRFREGGALSEAVREVYGACRRMQAKMRQRIRPEGAISAEEFESEILHEIDHEQTNAALDMIAENLEIDPIDDDFDPDEPFEPDWDAADRPTEVPH